jgi:hypothetical protein
MIILHCVYGLSQLLEYRILFKISFVTSDNIVKLVYLILCVLYRLKHKIYLYANCHLGRSYMIYFCKSDIKLLTIWAYNFFFASTILCPVMIQQDIIYIEHWDLLKTFILFFLTPKFVNDLTFTYIKF